MNAIEASVSHLQWLFITVMAIAITEGLKQFVREIRDNDENAHQPFRWECFFGLLALLATAMPFTYGMSRYFFEAYRRGPVGGQYSAHLALDTLGFTLSARVLCHGSVTFAAARADLRMGRVFDFSGRLSMVRQVSFHGAAVGRRTGTPLARARFSLGIPIAGLHFCDPHCGTRRDMCLHWAVCVILAGNAVYDLSQHWTFYFPTAAAHANAAGSKSTTKDETTVYFAGPLFTQAEWRWNAKLIQAMRGKGYDLIAPQEQAIAMLNGTTPFDPHVLFRTNIEGIERCNAVVAILDGADIDSGTAWECGYAYKIGRPIVGIRTDLRAGGDDPKASVNLMISQSCNKLVVLPFGKRDDEAWIAKEVIAALD